MNIKKNSLLLFCFCLTFMSAITQASQLLDALFIITNAATNGVVTHLQENSSKYISAVVITTIGATINNALNKHANNGKTNNKQLEELKVFLIFQDKKNQIALDGIQNQLETLQQLYGNLNEQLHFYKKREAIHIAQTEFYECLINKEQDCTVKRKLFEESQKKFVNDMLQHLNIKEVT